MPFLENVTRGRGIPRERLAAVAEHYLHFGGVSPINGINRALIDRVARRLASTLPVYFGNRNWEPYVEDAVAAMRDDGIRRAAVFTTSAWGGYSGCTQYVEDIAQGRHGRRRRRAGAGQTAPVLRPSAVRGDVHRRDHRGGRDAARRAARRRPAGVHRALDSAARPIPLWHRPLRAPGRRTRRRLVAAAAGYADYDQVWQSRSGPPQVPWLEPDVGDHLADARRRRAPRR